MAKVYDIFEGKLTKAAQYIPNAAAAPDISVITPAMEPRLVLEITELKSATGTPSANFVVQSTVDAFTANRVELATQVKGAINPSAPLKRSWPLRDVPNLRWGVASAELRPVLDVLGGGTPSITYKWWVETNE